MKKEYRIKKNIEFQKIIDAGRFKSCKSFVVYFFKRKGEHDRVGISVGKRIGNAVCRNKVKRQVRMMVHDIFDFNSGYDYIIIVRSKYNYETFETNKKELCSLYISVYNVIDKPKGE